MVVLMTPPSPHLRGIYKEYTEYFVKLQALHVLEYILLVGLPGGSRE